MQKINDVEKYIKGDFSAYLKKVGLADSNMVALNLLAHFDISVANPRYGLIKGVVAIIQTIVRKNLVEDMAANFVDVWLSKEGRPHQTQITNAQSYTRNSPAHN